MLPGVAFGSTECPGAILTASQHLRSRHEKVVERPACGEAPRAMKNNLRACCLTCTARPTQPKSFHLNGDLLGRARTVGLGVRRIIPQKLEERSVIGIAARFSGHVHLRALVPILRRVNAHLNLKLLDRVNGRQGDVGIEIRVGVVDPIEGIVIKEDTLSASGDGLVGAVAALPGTRLPRGWRKDVHIGRKGDEIQVLPAFSGNSVTILFSITVPTVAVSALSSALLLVIVSVSPTWPTSIFTSSRAVC